MLKIHDLYGQSYAHEFQFTNPDSIKNAVKRYNLQRAAEREEIKRDSEMHKLARPKFCKMRNTGNDVLGMVKSRDLDVETQMSLQLSDGSDIQLGSPRASSSDNSDQESGIQIGERLAGGADTVMPRSNTKTNTNINNKSRSKKRRNRKHVAAKRQPVESDAYAMHIEGLHREVCAELQCMEQPESEQKAGTTKRKLKQRRNKKQPIKQPIQQSKPALSQPKLAKTVPQRKLLKKTQIANKQSEHDKILQRLKQVLSVDQQQDMKQVSYEDYPQPQAQWADIIPSPMMPQVMHVNVCEAVNTTPSAACLFMEQHGNVEPEPEPLDAYFVEDSDLEQEYVDRPGYMRYIERLPYNLSEPNMTETTSSHKPCFVELEPHSHWISLQRSLKPMHYTSQRSETDTHTLCASQDPQQLLPGKEKIDTATDKSAQQQQQKARGTCSLKATALQTQTHTQSQMQAQAKSKPTRTTAPQTTRGRQLKRKSPIVTKMQELARQPGGRDVTALTPPAQLASSVSTATATAIATPTAPQINTPRRRKVRSVVCTRSLENLKFEKMSIYNKISLTQERIITAMDKLQGSLLQLQMPTCSNHEKQRRERNAFEFCVRFSRNYLYPLRGMIEDVRCTPVASFNSATSNEASQRVVCVYGLMHHSIGRYQRQLRYFLLDKVPQKLSALIEMMYTLTNVCLEKGVLDRQDPVVECLQQRCTSFLTFIEDMQEQRFQLARETYRRLQKRVHSHGHGPSRPGMHERYDLKMFLNDLKLYEPRLVPKVRSDKRRRGWVRKPKPLAAPSNAPAQLCASVEQPSEKQLDQPTEEVPTHIECVQCGDCRGDPSSDLNDDDQKHQLSNILALLQQSGQEKHMLHQQLLEAMQHVTKSQVREVLDPLVRSLGAMLDKKVKVTDEK